MQPRFGLAAAGLFAFALACTKAATSPQQEANDDEPALAIAEAPAPLPPLARVQTTHERAFAPSLPPLRPPGASPSDPIAREAYLREGRGQRNETAAWPVIPRMPGGGKPPKPGAHPARLLRFVHLTDVQLADDESPMRGTRYDSPTTAGPAMRPHEDYGCRLLLAATRTLRALHAQDPLDVVLLGGDNLDNAQENELDWFLQIMGGSPRVECDSGADDDPRPGPDNDAKDPFAALGLGVPWLWVSGNHDVNLQGNFPLDDAMRGAALGSAAFGGTRNHAKPGGPAEVGLFVVPDARRAFVTPQSLLGRVRNHGDGHGLSDTAAERGRAIYAWDSPRSNVRIVVLDTAHADGGANGVLQKGEVERDVMPLLDQAKADGKLVLLASHHATDALTQDGGAYGRVEPDAMLERQWLAWLARYPNVIASMVGHSHHHRVRALPSGGRVIWEVMTSALIDYPSQMRLVELFDEDNGWLSLRATALDLAFDDDPIGEEGRARGQVDYTAGWLADGRGKDDARNVVLWIPKPKTPREGR